MSNKKLLIGYVNTNDLASMNEDDIKALTGINIAFGTVHEGKVVWKGDHTRDALRRIRDLNPEIKIILSIGGWSAGGFSEAAATEEGRKLFAETAAEIVRDYELDGMDIDWEYPGISMAGIGASPEDKYTFTYLLESCREALDALGGEYKMLTIAAGGDAYFCRNTEMDKVAALCDYVQIMTYDLRGGYSHATGHHTNLYTPQFDFYDVSADTGVKVFEAAGVPREKIVIGAAFYSRCWRGVPNADNGYNQYAETVGQSGQIYDKLVDEFIGKNGFERFWDDSAKAPWLFDGETFISYDDPESLKHKVQYLKDEGLLGIMYWEYGCAVKHSLTQVLRDAIG